MIKYLLRTKDRRLIAIYILTSLLIYGAFWFSYYLLGGSLSLYLAMGIGFAGLLLLLIRTKSKKKDKNKEEAETPYDTAAEKTIENDEYRYSSFSATVKRPKFPFIPIISIIFINIGIGFIISTFFLFTEIVPSRFFGLVLLIMLGYKIAQLLLGEFFINKLKNKKLFGFLYSFCFFLEIIGAVLALIFAWNAAPIIWQVFYTFLLCIFYSFGQIYLRKEKKKSFWEASTMAYLMGFVFIFVATGILVLAILSQGDLDLGGLPDLTVSTEDKKKKKNTTTITENIDRIFKN